MTRPYIIANATVADLETCRAEFAELYREYGVVIFPKLLAKDPHFLSYIAAVRYLFTTLLQRQHVDASGVDDLGELLVRLNAVQPLDGKIITDMGTQHNKLFAFNQLKYSTMVEGVLNAIFPKDAVPATPQAGDTLHFFAPGEEYHPFNLPIHQDYPYLMQSPQQVTFYLGMSAYHEGVGGLSFWEKSHQRGVRKCTKNAYGAFELVDGEAEMQELHKIAYEWNAGDFAFFDSLLCHSSIPNTSENHGRVVQIFRFSNLNHAKSAAHNWYSTVYNNRRGADFIEAFPELYVAPATKA